MEKNWECVFQTQTDYLAEIAKDALAGEGIQAVVINKQDSNYHFGKLELYVDRDNVIQSMFLLKNIGEE